MRTLTDLFGMTPAWHRDAVCATIGNYDAWFPSPVDDNRGDYAYAKIVCATCPVQTQCLEFALETREPWGCWGGKAPRERQRILRQRGQSLIPGLGAA